MDEMALLYVELPRIDTNTFIHGCIYQFQVIQAIIRDLPGRELTLGEDLLCIGSPWKCREGIEEELICRALRLCCASA